MGEFDDLKGLPPEESPYKKRKIPIKLDTTEGHKDPSVSLNGWDILNIIFAFLRNKSLEELIPRQKLDKARQWSPWIWVSVAVIIIILYIIFN